MKKVWILDDDKSIRWVFEKALSRAKLPFQSFSNTNEAINQATDMEGNSIINYSRPTQNLEPNVRYQPFLHH